MKTWSEIPTPWCDPDSVIHVWLYCRYLIKICTSPCSTLTSTGTPFPHDCPTGTRPPWMKQAQASQATYQFQLPSRTNLSRCSFWTVRVVIGKKLLTRNISRISSFLTKSSQTFIHSLEVGPCATTVSGETFIYTSRRALFKLSAPSRNYYLLTWCLRWGN
jgi:hypothetical protein